MKYWFSWIVVILNYLHDHTPCIQCLNEPVLNGTKTLCLTRYTIYLVTVSTNFFEILSSAPYPLFILHSNNCNSEQFRLLGCGALRSYCKPTFQRNIAVTSIFSVEELMREKERKVQQF
jgi:hypothetical protein